VAQAFVAIGGRLMINADGKFEDAISLDVLFGNDLPEDVA
jgi:hypothetical protein